MLRSSWLLTSCLLIAAPHASRASDISLSLGGFRFHATDYYYPYFFTEAGPRGEITYAFGNGNVRYVFRLLATGYPMDDNCFDPALEVGFEKSWSFSRWRPVVTPVVGVGVTKFQYPAPHYPNYRDKAYHVQIWFRAGGDLGLAYVFNKEFSASAFYRFRLFAAANPWPYIGSGNKTLHTPGLEVRFSLTRPWSFIARGGADVGGWYDDAFLLPEYLSRWRPFAEVGFAYSW